MDQTIFKAVARPGAGFLVGQSTAGGLSYSIRFGPNLFTYRWFWRRRRVSPGMPGSTPAVRHAAPSMMPTRAREAHLRWLGVSGADEARDPGNPLIWHGT